MENIYFPQRLPENTPQKWFQINREKIWADGVNVASIKYQSVLMQPLLLHYKFSKKTTKKIMSEIKNLIEIKSTGELWDTTWKEGDQ